MTKMKLDDLQNVPAERFAKAFDAPVVVLAYGLGNTIPIYNLASHIGVNEEMIDSNVLGSQEAQARSAFLQYDDSGVVRLLAVFARDGTYVAPGTLYAPDGPMDLREPLLPGFFVGMRNDFARAKGWVDQYNTSVDLEGKLRSILEN